VGESGWAARRWDAALDAAAFIIALWTGGILPGLVMMLILMRLMVRSLGAQTPQGGIASAGVSLIGVLWLGGAGGLMALTRTLEGGREGLLFLLAVVWANDVGAYYVGRGIGRRRLAPMVSPNKTVEGCVGGLVFGAVVGSAVAAWFHVPGLGPYGTPLAALVLGGLGQLGDLFESLFKRAAGAKDSARFIPGHGGLLDIIDGLLLCAPPFYYFLYWNQIP